MSASNKEKTIIQKAFNSVRHTPGPWLSICPPTISMTTRMVKAENGDIIAHIGPQGWARDTSQEIADARLIAAAPDLLNTLLLVDNELNSWPENGRWLGIQVRAAISRARGES